MSTIVGALHFVYTLHVLAYTQPITRMPTFEIMDTGQSKIWSRVQTLHQNNGERLCQLYQKLELCLYQYRVYIPLYFLTVVCGNIPYITTTSTVRHGCAYNHKSKWLISCETLTIMVLHMVGTQYTLDMLRPLLTVLRKRKRKSIYLFRPIKSHGNFCTSWVTTIVWLSFRSELG